MFNIYETITNKIIDLMEQGTIAWRKPWNAQTNMPKMWPSCCVFALPYAPDVASICL